MRCANIQFASWTQYPPGFVAKLQKVNLKVFDNILCNDCFNRVISKWPRASIQIVNEMNSIPVRNVDVEIAAQPFRPGAQIKATKKGIATSSPAAGIQA